MTASLTAMGGKVVQLADYDPRAPEDLIPHLFAREAALNRELAEVRAALAVQRRRYAERHGLCVFPSIETLRGLFT